MAETMAGSESAEVVRRAAQEVLETMFFAVVDEEFAEVQAEELLYARVPFHSAWSGALELSLPAAAAESIASDFLGLRSGEQVSPDQVTHVVGELTNMICGTALSHLESDCAFDLGTPRAIERLTAAAGAAIEVSLPLDQGPVTIYLYAR